MKEIPYLLVFDTTLAGNGTATVNYTVPQNEQLDLYDMVFKSAGSFNIIDIRDSAGNHYTNASAASEIPSVVLASGANNNNALKSFVTPLVVIGGTIIYVDLEDSSGSSNRVQLILSGKRTLGG